jgi:hypothetical protein
VNPRQEAHERLGGAYEVRVLEPSPPAVTEPPWIADDPVARGSSPARKPIVSPVTTGDITWDELTHDDAELAGWCANRWLGAWLPLPQLPPADAFAATRHALHTVAEHVLARARYEANGKIGLRFTRHGFGTPWFRHGDQDAQVRVENGRVIVRCGDETRSAEITTVAAAAELAGIEPGAPANVYAPETPLEPDAVLVVDDSSARFLGEWYGFAASVVEQVRAEASPADQPSRVQLWPEHFDLSIDLGDEPAGGRGTFGASPGDDAHSSPYLYVTHWSPVPADEYWNATSFEGASLSIDVLADTRDQRGAALAFYRRGQEVLRAAATAPGPG